MKRSYLMLLGAIILYSLISVLSKAAALQDFLSIPFLCLYGGALLLLAAYAVVWQLCLEKVPLVAAYAMRGLMFVLIGIWSYIFFHETLTLIQWIGMLVIIAGVFVSQSDELGERGTPGHHADQTTGSTAIPGNPDEQHHAGGTNA